MKPALFCRGLAAGLLFATYAACSSAAAGDDAERLLERAGPTVVMIIGAEQRGPNDYAPVSSGSGTIVSTRGAVLTNHHVLVDSRTGSLFDAFFIARHYPGRSHPEVLCRGNPHEAIRKLELDLALVQCDRDLDDRPWRPFAWPTAYVGPSQEMSVGQRIWVLGYPITGQGALSQSGGLLLGRTGDAPGKRTFLTTDAAISYGNSGGGTFNENAELVGIPTAFRHSTSEDGHTRTVSGLIVPIEAASDLIDLAQRGWQSGDADDLEQEPAFADTGDTQIAVSVRSTLDRSPIAGAMVLIVPGAVTPSATTVAKLSAGAAAIGISDGKGYALCSPPIATGRSYRAVLIAPGHWPSADPGEFAVPAGAGPYFTPSPTSWLSPILRPQQPENI